MTTLSEQDFRVRSDEALEHAQRALLPLADEHGFEVERHDDVLDVVFEEPATAKFVVSPNAPVRQIWISAMSRSFKLPWNAELGTFALEREKLSDVLVRLTRAFLDGAK